MAIRLRDGRETRRDGRGTRRGGRDDGDGRRDRHVLEHEPSREPGHGVGELDRAVERARDRECERDDCRAECRGSGGPQRADADGREREQRVGVDIRLGGREQVGERDRDRRTRERGGCRDD